MEQRTDTAGPLWLGIFTAAYLAANWLGLQFHYLPNNVSTVWPAGGIYVAALLLTPYRVWPYIVVATFSSVLLKMGLPNLDIVRAMVYAIANSVEALLIAYVVRQFLEEPVDFTSARQVLIFFIAAIIGPGAGAMIAHGVLADPSTPRDYLIQVWWFGDALSTVIVAPLIITWARLSHFPFRAPTPHRAFEVISLGGSLFVTCYIVFALQPATETAWDYTYVVLPFLIWAALRFDPRGVATAVAMIAVCALFYGARGMGPFGNVSLTPDLELQSLQAFVALITFSSYLLSGVVTEREKGVLAMKELAEEQNRLLLQAQTDERETLARELHDGVGQMLVGLRLKLSSKPSIANELEDEIGDLSQTINTVSKISRLLYPPELEHTELVTAIDQHLTTNGDDVKPVVALESRGNEPVLSRPAKNHLYRIVQETITNVHKHANANSVEIKLEWTDESLTLRIQDDGRGLPERIHTGLGLRSVRTRAAAMAGRAEWRRNPSGGTTVEVAVPLSGIISTA